MSISDTESAGAEALQRLQQIRNIASEGGPLIDRMNRIFALANGQSGHRTVEHPAAESLRVVDRLLEQAGYSPDSSAREFLANALGHLTA